MADRMSKLRQLEGGRVSLALADGSRIDDSSLVSVGRGPSATLWVFSNGCDLFIPCAEIVDAWETASPRCHPAA
jgi:hypothetical protein